MFKATVGFAILAVLVLVLSVSARAAEKGAVKKEDEDKKPEDGGVTSVSKDAAKRATSVGREAEEENATNHKNKKNSYVSEMPKEVSDNGTSALARLQEQKEEHVTLEGEIKVLLRLLHGNPVEENAGIYALRDLRATVIPVLAEYYLSEKDIAVRRRVLVLIAYRSRQDNYREVLPFLIKECFNKHVRLRAVAINAMTMVMKKGGPQKRGDKGWLPKEELEGIIQILVLVANSGPPPYPRYQREAGKNLFRYNRDNLIPADLLKSILEEMKYRRQKR